MNRSRFLAAVVALGGLLGAAEVRSASDAHQARLEEFQKKATKDRQTQGLDKNRAALFSKYPSPEVKLAGAELPVVPIGSETTITATGHFLPGSLAQTVCGGAEVLSEKVTDSRLEARVRVSSTALAGPCGLRVYSPVSMAYATRDAFRVAGNYQWELALSNGTKVRLSTSTEQGNPAISGSSEWFGKDGKSLGTRSVRVQRLEDGYRVRVEGAAASSDEGSAPAAINTADQEKQLAELQQKIQKECMTLPQDKMSSCIQKYAKEITAISQKIQGKAQAATQQQVAANAGGCESLMLQVSAGKVTGKASGCSSSPEVPLTGTISAVK